MKMLNCYCGVRLLETNYQFQQKLKSTLKRDLFVSQSEFYRNPPIYDQSIEIYMPHTVNQSLKC